MKKLTSTPEEDGFYMPAEFECHRRTYMVWPQRSDNWRRGAKPAQRVYAKIAAAIADFEEVVMLVNKDQYTHARHFLDERIIVVEMSSNDAWARDIGPTFVRDLSGRIRGIDWRFNAWGGRTDGIYFPWDLDDQLAGKVCELERADCYSLTDFILEGGSIHVDGQGTALVTEACLLSKGRNPDYSKSAIEAKLKNYLNVQKVIWLPRGIYLDETNEHVDNICAFIRPAEVVLSWTENQQDPQYLLSKCAFEELNKQTDSNGRSIKIHKIPLPEPIEITEKESREVDFEPNTLPRMAGDRLAASYANFYFCNGAVILPAFGDPQDECVKQQFENLFPERKIIQINTHEVLLGGGNIHCITQQVPK